MRPNPISKDNRDDLNLDLGYILLTFWKYKIVIIFTFLLFSFFGVYQIKNATPQFLISMDVLPSSELSESSNRNSNLSSILGINLKNNTRDSFNLYSNEQKVIVN